MIPPIIHFVWIGSPLPAWAARNIEEFRRLNPRHEIRLHTADAAPDRYRSVWDAAMHPSTKGDMIRLDQLRQWGGWYFDVDYWPCRPLADAERAFALDGCRLFCARMNNPRVNNGVLACGPGCAALDALDAIILAGGLRHGQGTRTMYGPPVLTRLAAERPQLLRIADWPWFHGVRDADAAKLWRRCRASGTEILTRWIPQTGGQLPFAFHLWAHTHGAALAAGDRTDPTDPTHAEGLRLVAIVGKSARDTDDSDRPYPLLAQAVAAIGWRAEIVPWDVDRPLDLCSAIPDAVVVWNGRKDRHAGPAVQAREMGCPVLYLEHGFFDRNRYFQCDHQGILHWASWRRKIAGPAPAKGAERLTKFLPAGPAPQRINRSGYVLALGQVEGDSQLDDSEIRGPLQLQKAVKNALPEGVAAFFRPHPQTAMVTNRKAYLPCLSDQDAERDGYRRTRHGTGLTAALKGCRFVVTINSNAITEALAAGVPCLALGPSLAIDAGAVHAATAATLRADIAEMLAGWRADDARVLNYLRWLAARQWTVEEFADPALLTRLLAAAGVVASSQEPVAGTVAGSRGPGDGKDQSDPSDPTDRQPATGHGLPATAVEVGA